MKKVTAIAMLLMCSSAYSRPWGKSDNPRKFEITIKNLNQIPDYGLIDLDQDGAPWSGYHWPNKHNNMDYKPGNQKQSPLDKWYEADIHGDFFDIKKFFRDEKRVIQGNTWGGFCHAYSATAINYKEPTKKVLNGVTFYHSDIKAIMAAYYDYVMAKGIVKTYMLGSRCNKDIPQGSGPGDKNGYNCDDLNAGSFHMALNELINVRNHGVVMDMNSGNEVWNVPIIGYEAKNMGEYAGYYRSKARGTVSIIEYHTTLKYLGYQKPEEDFEVPGVKGQKVKSVTYKYLIELNKHGNIIGGEWLESKHPDFLWYSSELPEPSGKWAPLNELLNEY